MKRTTILTFLCYLLLIIPSCKKNNNDSARAGSITATVNGADVSFNTDAGAVRGQGGNLVLISGFDGAVGNSNRIFIQATAASPITTGIYDAMSSNYGIGWVLYVSAGTQDNYLTANSVDNPGTVTITEITSTYVKGTFSGDAFLQTTAGPSTTRKIITNGQFLVYFK